MDMKEILSEFSSEISHGKLEIYNEFSLQHEFGIFLRNHYRSDMVVQFERNVSFFFHNTSIFLKKEIDIAVFSRDKKELSIAIELKFPRNGQYPEQMFSFCKDIVFTEQLKEAGFNRTFFIAFADDPLFYLGNSEGIYGFFRGGKTLCGKIQKPTGQKIEFHLVRGQYIIEWHSIIDNLKYTFVETNL